MPLAVQVVLWQSFFVAVLASEAGKAVSKETKVDILVTPLVTIGVGIALFCTFSASAWKGSHESGKCDHVGNRASAILMGILVSVFVGIALTLPISSAAICAALGTYRTGRRSSSSRLLCTDGRLCSYVFPGE